MVRYQNLTRKPNSSGPLEPGPPRPGPGYDVTPEPVSRRPWFQEGRWLQRAQQRAHELERGPSKWHWEISMWGLKTFFFFWRSHHNSDKTAAFSPSVLEFTKPEIRHNWAGPGLTFGSRRPCGRLHLWSHCFDYYSRFLTIRENGDKNCFENWELCIFRQFSFHDNRIVQS